ncbi:hypothetical protein CCH79_00017569 [Gambusia affinis]|uniref:Uncharacterized protein n=1 Tax=Gambusia affinis TaxID=33528 RepID=A0A315VEL6_GAMAF|nr:hypothetical protein CCH79_00017569 [Gambusia affinis]
MMEQSGQHTSPADAVRRALSEQHSLLQTHESALWELSTRQTETNRRLAELINFLQNSVPQSTSPELAPDPVPPARSTFSEICPPTPERFSGHLSRVFSHDGAKITYVLSLLSDWAEARFPSPASYGCTFDDFLKEFKQIFSQDSDKIFNSCELWE